MKQWGFYFDQSRCLACNACTIACKIWNEDHRGDAGLNPELSWLQSGKYAEPAEYDNLQGSTGEQNYAELRKYHMKENWRRVTATEYGDLPPAVDVLNLSLSCNHCTNPPCARVCPVRIISKDPDTGIVLVDTPKCVTCGACLRACPWKAPQFYLSKITGFEMSDPLRPKMTKCTLCIDRIKQGLKPACVAACQNRALDAGPVDELKAKYKDWTDKVDNFEQDKDAGPNIIFKKKKLKV